MGLGFAVFAGTSPEVIRACAREAERLGYSSFWVNHPGSTDGLAALAHAARETQRIELGIGVIPLHTRGPESIALGVKSTGLPLDRLLLGVGSPNPEALKRVRAGIADLRRQLSTRLIVAALGPQMCRLAGEVADGVLFNWLTPEYARESAGRVREARPPRSVRCRDSARTCAWRSGPRRVIDCRKRGTATPESRRTAPTSRAWASSRWRPPSPPRTPAPSSEGSPGGRARSTRSSSARSPRRTPSRTTWRSCERPRPPRAPPLPDAVAPDQPIVEDQPEAGALGNVHHPVLDRRAVRPHRLPHRIALGIGEALGIGAVRHRRQQVLRDLRLLVVRHL